MNLKIYKSKKVLLTVGLFGVLLALVAYFWNQSPGKAASYKTHSIHRGNLEVTILATGTVQPENRLDIKAPVAGRMDEILVQEGAKVRKGQIIALMSSSERAAMLDAARAKGPEEYKSWAELYLPTPIMAPISGTIILRHVEPGQTFTVYDAIFTMSDRLAVKAQVDETDIAHIQLKQPAEIVLDAYPAHKIKAEAQQIAFDSRVINSVTTYIVDVLPLETPAFMRSGMTANVTFFVESKKNVLLVANEALKVQEGLTYLLIRGKEDTPEWREIQVGLSDGKNTEILGGVHEGEAALVEEVNLKREKKGSNPFSPMGGSRPRRGSGGVSP